MSSLFGSVSELNFQFPRHLPTLLFSAFCVSVFYSGVSEVLSLSQQLSSTLQSECISQSCTAVVLLWRRLLVKVGQLSLDMLHSNAL